MAGSKPFKPTDPADSGAEASTPQKPDWLMGAEEGARRESDGSGRPEAVGAGRLRIDGARPARPIQQGRKQPPPLRLVSPIQSPASPATAPSDSAPAQAGSSVAWKAASSSVPRLRQQPVASTELAAAESFPGFTQDGIAEKDVAPIAAAGAEPDDGPLNAPPPDPAMPLDRAQAFWVDWLDRLSILRRPVVLGAVALMAFGAAMAIILHKHDSSGVSLARIRQQPEAFEGRSVLVRGRAGEAYPVGDSYVFDLYQGRDTVVVYSRSRRPRLHEQVQVGGTVSVGYLDGAPRVAVLEDTQAR